MRTELPWSAVRRMVDLPPLGEPVDGIVLELPGRGSTYVVDTGPRDAPTLMLLHAVACTGMLTWYPVLDKLREHYRVVVFDQRWHGHGIRSDDFTMGHCADDAMAVADALGIDRFIPVGYSMGSLVAQQIWRSYPQRVAGLVLCATTASFRRTAFERWILRSFDWMLPTRTRHALRLTRQLPTPPEPTGDRHVWALAQFRSTTATGIRQAISAITRFDSSSWINQVDVPTALIITSKDHTMHPARQRWVAQKIDNSISYEIHAGHAACVLEADEFRPTLIAACATVAARAS